MHNIFAIIVIYHPREEHLFSLIETLKLQTKKVIVVDNDSESSIEPQLKTMFGDCCEYINQGQNTGIGSAFNAGIVYSRKNSASHVLLFDQDSMPREGMVESLLAAMCDKSIVHGKIAAAGPKYVDVKGLTVSPVALEGLRLRQIPCCDDEVFEVDHLISSGCLIEMDALNDVGDMNESLFIDYVDVEWSLRAKNKGYSLLGVCGATMQHDMGDKFANILNFKANVHTPLRNYYMMRNGIWLVSRAWLPLNRRVAELFKLTKKYIVYSLFIGSCYTQWRMMTKGVWHALNGTMGKYEN